MTKITLTDDQQLAADEFIDFLLDPKQKYQVIQGAAGSGKSFLIKYLIDNFEAQCKAHRALLSQTADGELPVLLTATTNKAVAVVKEFAKMNVRTIHSVLGLKVINDFKTGKTKLQKTKEHEEITDTLIIIDEASFMDNPLFEILDKSTPGCKVLLVGDQYQLAPVGQTLSVMETLQCPKAMMNKIMRNSGIIMQTGQQFRNTVKSGTFSPILYSNYELMHADGPTFQKLVNDAYLDPEYTSHKAKILGWTNLKVQEYNSYIRGIKELPPAFQEGETVVTNNPIVLSGGVIPVDSEVIITSVDEEDMLHNIHGRWVTINHSHTAFLPNNFHEVKMALKRLAKAKKWKEFFGIKDTWLDLRSVYASSIHKSQGSTYETVFVDLTDIGKNWIPSDVARLLYVAISRASKKVVCYGQLPGKYSGV